MSNLPKGWEIVKLSKLLKLKGGNAFKSNDFIDKGIPVLKISNINKSGQIDLKDYVCVEELEEYKDYLLAENDIVVAMSGATTGKMGRVKFKDLPLYLNQRVGKFEIKNKDILDNDFLYFNVNSPQFIEKLLVNAIGGAQPNISSKQIEELEIPIPPLEEQKKIADILSTVDKKIAFVEENINATEELKKGLMQKLLTEGIGHTEFKDSELGRIPESWEINLLDRLAKRGSGHTPNKQISNYWNGGIKWVSLSDSNKMDNRYIYFTSKEISLAGIQNSSAVIHPKETVILVRDAGVGKSAILAYDMAVSQHFMAWICGESLNNIFLYYWLQSKKQVFESIAIGSTIKTIGLEYFKKLKMPLPHIEEQKQIAEILSTVDNKLENLKEKKQFFEELKKGLMQKLLTGEVRL
ncbi:restriction endonuclease subunit S [Aliarcobacter butzleri]|uniref:restriction endonuclease subunit S n=1 Tax=Aliarcobacter butzleri TaxID=28197 RepID=UPI00126124F0|nr:restriction endonuclease subunit S [Aliarcobacter butzleri]